MQGLNGFRNLCRSGALSENTGYMRVGRWQVDPDAGSMTDGRKRVQVPPRLMNLLQLLVREAGSTVSRESLIEALWPRGYVNEEALSRAVNELRGLLGDDARTPEFIRTVPKKGYRLIADVGPAETPRRPARGRNWMIASAVAALVTVLATVILNQDRKQLTVDMLSTAKRLTSEPGLEWHPQISSDGQWVAQVVSREGQGAIQLFPTSAPEQQRVITHPKGLYSPVFSPDAARLATLSGRADGCSVLLWPVTISGDAASGSAIDLGSCYRLTTLGVLDWSPDGEWLAYTDRDEESGATVLTKLRLSDGNIVSLTRLSDPYQSDQSPRFSPDGRWLSFSRGTRAVRELWLLDLADPDAEPRQLTYDGQFTSGHDWWPDGESIIMDSDRSGHRALWKLSLNGEMALLGARDAQSPSIADTGDILFQVAQYEANIWILDAVSGESAPEPLIASTKYDSMPIWSPDGSEIAFTTNRTGDGGIWIASADGSRAREIYAPDEGRVVGPRWMNDGLSLLATEYRPGVQQLVRVALNRREVKVIDTAGERPYSPSHPANQPWIYYLAGSEKGGSELWRTAADGIGEHQQVMDGPINHYEVSADGDIFFTRYQQPGLWRHDPGKGGATDLVLEDLPTWAGEDWTIHANRVYFLNSEGINQFSLETGEISKVSDGFDNTLGPSISVHPDGHSILISRTDRAETDLFLARHHPD